MPITRQKAPDTGTDELISAQYHAACEWANRAAGYFTVAARLRYHSQYPHHAVALITDPLTTHA